LRARSAISSPSQPYRMTRHSQQPISNPSKFYETPSRIRQERQLPLSL
jgi:hypothetical protein